MSGRLEPRLFTDRDLGQRFPQIFAAAGVTVERHGDHFAHDCPDEAWLESVGQRGWVVVTHDARIRYKPNELAAVVRHRVALLVVVGHAPYPQFAGHPAKNHRVPRQARSAGHRQGVPAHTRRACKESTRTG